MNQITPMPKIEIIPASAPFSEAQRSWLNGFLAGALGLDGSMALSPAQNGAVLAPAGDADDGEAPWHDQTLPIAERMKLAEGRPLRRRLMAAMAQQDCGQCGYNCSDYSDAIANRSEARLNLCVPGGKETARMVKALYEELDKAPAAAKPAAVAAMPATVSVVVSEPGRSRDNPVEATFLSRRLLNKPGSEKETWHIEFDLGEAGLDYVVGDSFGIFAKNDLGLVDQIIALLGASHITQVNGKPLRQCLLEDVSLSPAPDSLFELISFITGGATREKARRLAQGEDPDGDAATLDVMAVLQKFSGVRPHPEAFVEALEPLQPRLYSISSSHNATPGRLSLTVDCVRYVIGKRKRLGLASTFLAERINPGDRLRVYVQKAHGFALPADPKTPIIMVGPGTGIAPFRAFLQEREALGAPGKTWLFFGDRNRSTDFLYEDEINAWRDKGVLHRLDTAFSRDQA
ncbi:sulfite reductase subunit alpha, partial [Bradyrhizobium sp.]|uniref:sulfite reductase subunit alpha n=1 Tax=Bradyrhizobium sp. TaxID=376 RepID=UPI003918B7BD